MDMGVVPVGVDSHRAAVESVVIAGCFTVVATVVGDLIVGGVNPEFDGAVVVVSATGVDDHRQVVGVIAGNQIVLAI